MPAKGVTPIVMSSQPGSVAVIGGGVIGLSVAREAARGGWRVTVHDDGRKGPSWVAGGMLAPYSEAWPGEDDLLDLGIESLRIWRDGFIDDDADNTVITARGSLTVAVDTADVGELRTMIDWLAGHGHTVAETTNVRDVEPLLAQNIRRGFTAPEELAVDNRKVLQALTADCAALGVRRGPAVANLDEASADQIVVANGVDAATLANLPVRPVKGEVLRLRRRPGAMPPPTHVIRARVHGRHVYLVPREDGVVVGATQYEHGHDTAPAVAGVRDLLDDACAVLPCLGEYEFAECAAGLRPMTEDNLPLVGRIDDRTLVAAGHGRSGFLLAPWTAKTIGALLDGGESPAAVDPRRFEKAHSQEAR
ncbi:Glycine oxidase [Mycobacteroides salmoniphilum]|uniref:glycine oxidase n=2 Tax=Mycobacteroides salmoniphilum TaxID=404941 RepID=A0A4R8S2J1_9MYCO|nr:Glycine oxidase [Mycobacteroides salmoniphilum]TDZ78138.1 Glycine oxidase [Mycobacteroides salmoniphilum]TDZ84666.1 Glycine oxidase [Mycobacteroides salmoniphilum]